MWLGPIHTLFIPIPYTRHSINPMMMIMSLSSNGMSHTTVYIISR